MLSASGQVLSRRLSLAAPFSPGDYVVDVPPFSGVEVENRLADSASETASRVVATTESSSLIGEIQSPATFVARTGCVCGHRVMWADITPMPPTAVHLADICNFDAAHTGSWQAVVRVTMRSGAILHYELTGSGPSPQGWAPAVAFPAPGAMLIEVYTTASGNTLYGSMPLARSADGSCAFALDSQLQASDFTPFSGTIPAAGPSAATVSYRGAVVVTPISAPLIPLKAAVCCSAPIVALSPARRSLSAWDSAAARAYAFSSAGIFAINAGTSDATPISAALIDRRPILSAAAVTSTPSGVMAASGDNLLIISGAAVKERKMAADILAMAWDFADSRLWMLHPQGNVALYHLYADSVSALYLPVSISAVSGAGSQPLLTSPEGLWMPSSPTQPRPVAWSGTAAVHGTVLQSIGRLSLTMRASASRFTGSLTVTASDSADSAHPITASATVSVDGALRSPVLMRLALPPAPFISLTLIGEASPDFYLYGFTLNSLSR